MKRHNVQQKSCLHSFMQKFSMQKDTKRNFCLFPGAKASAKKSYATILIVSILNVFCSLSVISRTIRKTRAFHKELCRSFKVEIISARCATRGNNPKTFMLKKLLFIWKTISVRCKSNTDNISVTNISIHVGKSSLVGGRRKLIKRDSSQSIDFLCWHGPSTYGQEGKDSENKCRARIPWTFDALHQFK